MYFLSFPLPISVTWPNKCGSLTPKNIKFFWQKFVKLSRESGIEMTVSCHSVTQSSQHIKILNGSFPLMHILFSCWTWSRASLLIPKKWKGIKYGHKSVGRTYQLVMYSQCREKREGRLSYVWNTPVEFSGACFCSLVESFMNHSTRVLLAWLKLTPCPPPFLSKHGAVCCCCCCCSSSAGGHMGKVSYHTP